MYHENSDYKEGRLLKMEDEDFDEGLSPNSLYLRIEPLYKQGYHSNFL